MAEEIQEAVQIIRVAYDGIEIAMKVGSGGIAAMQKAIDFLKGMLDYEKSLGKTSMRKLILKGGDLQVLQFNTEVPRSRSPALPAFPARHWGTREFPDPRRVPGNARSCRRSLPLR